MVPVKPIPGLSFTGIISIMEVFEEVFEPVIGLEVHAQLLTQSKMFCSCPADYQKAPPNSLTCPICLGLPGALPVINRAAIQAVIMTGLALNSEISPNSKFDRKNYPYPDLMKGYQISQYDFPICVGGYLGINIGGLEKQIKLTRVHLEEDVAKLLHRVDPKTGDQYSLLDVNRSGVPLMELVSEPDMRSPEEARQYLIELRSILQYLEVSSGNMEEGSFRCDANVSVRPKGSGEFFNRVEIKNMNSFRSVFKALEYEVDRQVDLVRKGAPILQETRGWSEERAATFSMRSKEHAHDYRYFPEPDLPPIRISETWIQEISENLPELPSVRKTRLQDHHGLPDYDANTLTMAKHMADYYEQTVGYLGDREPGLSDEEFHRASKLAANWILTDLTRLLNAAALDLEESPMGPFRMADFLSVVFRGSINGAQAKRVLDEMFASDSDSADAIKRLGISQLTDILEIETVVDAVLKENEQAVRDFQAGKSNAIKFLVGQVMKVTQGTVNPSTADRLIREKLG